MIDLYYEQHGLGTPLLMIHGIISDHSYFDSIIPYLADDYHIITYDRRGYGQSFCSTDTFDILQQTDDLLSIIHELPVEKLYVLGHSAGCIIAAKLALVRPDLVRGLLLIEPSFGLNPTDSALLTEWNNELNRYRESGKVSMVLRAFASRVGGIEEKENRKAFSKDKLIATKKNLENFLHGEINDVQQFRFRKEDLEEIKCPVTIGITTKGATHMFGAISFRDSELLDWPVVWLPGCHDTLEQYPEECSKRIKMTLSEWSTIYESS